MSWISAYAASAAQFIHEHTPERVSSALSAARDKAVEVYAAVKTCFEPPEGYPYAVAYEDSEGDPVELVRQQTERENLELQIQEVYAREVALKRDQEESTRLRTTGETNDI